MLNTQDKKYISSEVANQISRALKENNEILISGMRDLFDATNERIDKVLEKLDDHDRRLGKIEDKVFITTSA